MGQENNEPLESRPPTKEDFLKICRNLNTEGVDYIVVGGMAIIQHGYLRTTEDIDLLVSTSPENESRLIKALMCLPDKAIKDLQPGDIEEYTVIRIADEVIVDLMKSACGISYVEAKESIVRIEIEGVEIPFASLELLWKMKQTHREKDELDLVFLREKLRKDSRDS